MPERFTPGVGGSGEEQPGFRGLIPLAAITAPKWNLRPNLAEIEPRYMRLHRINPEFRYDYQTGKASMVIPKAGSVPAGFARVHEFQHLGDMNVAPTLIGRSEGPRRYTLTRPLGRSHAGHLRTLLAELRAGMAEQAAGLPRGAAKNLRAYGNLEAPSTMPGPITRAARELYPGVPNPIDELVHAAGRDPVALHENVLQAMRWAKVPSKIVNILRQTIPQMIAKGVRGPTDLALQMIPQSLLQQMSEQIQGPRT